MNAISDDVILICKNKLLERKSILLNNFQNFKPPEKQDTSGDFGDQNLKSYMEHEWCIMQKKIRVQLLEIELALGKIQLGRFGICEETEETINVNRLMSIPWTRYSIEGASFKETSQRL